MLSVDSTAVRPRSITARRSRGWIGLLAALLCVGFGPASQAGVLFSFSTQSIDAHTVDVYLHETATPANEIISAEGGLDFAGFQLAAVSPPANPMQIASISPDAAFDGSNTLPNGTTGFTLTLDTLANPPAFGSITSNGGDLRLARVTFVAGALAQATNFQISQIAPGDYTFTDTGASSIESRFGIGSSPTFNIAPNSTPEPAGLAVIALGGLGLMGRRRK